MDPILTHCKHGDKIPLRWAWLGVPFSLLFHLVQAVRLHMAAPDTMPLAESLLLALIAGTMLGLLASFLLGCAIVVLNQVTRRLVRHRASPRSAKAGHTRT